MSGIIDCCGVSHLPKSVPANEDEFLVADLNRSLRIHQTSLGLDDHSRVFGNSRGKLLIVADGVGQKRSAERASTLAVDAVTQYILNSMRWLNRAADATTATFRDELRAALQECQQTIQHEGQVINDHEGMAANITMGYILWPRLFVVHAGSGRCYLMRNNRLQQLAPEPDASDCEQPPIQNVVGGTSNSLVPHLASLTLQPDDRLLFCTDGLHRSVSELDLGETLRRDDPSEAILERLVQTAIQNNADDAVTGIVIRFSAGNADPLDEDGTFADASASELVATNQPKAAAPDTTQVKDQIDKDVARTR